MENGNRGWIKVHRDVQSQRDWVANRSQKATLPEAWLDLMLLANHKTSRIEDRGEIVVIRRGQVLTSILTLSSRWGWSRNRLRRWLAIQEELGTLTTYRTNRRTIITICDYEITQRRESSNEPADGPLEALIRTKRRTTSKKLKKKEKKELASYHLRMTKETGESDERWPEIGEATKARIDELKAKVEEQE